MTVIHDDPTERIRAVEEATLAGAAVRRAVRRKSIPGSPERNAKLDGAITDLSFRLQALRRDAGRLQWSDSYERRYGQAVRKASREAQEERRSLRRMRRRTR